MSVSVPVAPIRTITLGLAETHPLPLAVIRRASVFLQQAQARYTNAGYEVQTVRLSTRPVFADLVEWSPAMVLNYVEELQHELDSVGLSFCSLGTAQVAQPDFPLEQLDVIPDLLNATTAMNMTVQLATKEHGVRAEAALPIARIMRRLAHETEEGFGNFRFAMLACVDAGCPFFPTAYHAGPTSLTLGMQGAGVIAHALHSNHATSQMLNDATRITQVVRTALEAAALPIVALGQAIAQEQSLHFGGIDLSPAPLGEDSIVAAMEAAGFGPLGSPGTLTVAAALTTALKSTTLPTCGYCGLMLPVLEDALLGKRWQEGRVHIDDLLLYSAVCGTGLDTIPLAGDMPAEVIAHLLQDVATLAVRLQKPLSARLFPVPGKAVGDYTTFSSPYLTNTVVGS